MQVHVTQHFAYSNTPLCLCTELPRISVLPGGTGKRVGANSTAELSVLLALCGSLPGSKARSSAFSCQLERPRVQGESISLVNNPRKPLFFILFLILPKSMTFFYKYIVKNLFYW